MEPAEYHGVPVQSLNESARFRDSDPDARSVRVALRKQRLSQNDARLFSGGRLDESAIILRWCAPTQPAARRHCGLCGATVTLSGLLQHSTRAGRTLHVGDDVSLIIVFLRGGLSTIDTVDLKSQAPAEVRGEFSPIETCVPGTLVCEHLSKMARQMDKFSLVARSRTLTPITRRRTTMSSPGTPCGRGSILI